MINYQTLIWNCLWPLMCSTSASFVCRRAHLRRDNAQMKPHVHTASRTLPRQVLTAVGVRAHARLPTNRLVCLTISPASRCGVMPTVSVRHSDVSVVAVTRRRLSGSSRVIHVYLSFRSLKHCVRRRRFRTARLRRPLSVSIITLEFLCEPLRLLRCPVLLPSDPIYPDVRTPVPCDNGPIGSGVDARSGFRWTRPERWESGLHDRTIGVGCPAPICLTNSACFSQK